MTEKRQVSDMKAVPMYDYVVVRRAVGRGQRAGSRVERIAHVAGGLGSQSQVGARDRTLSSLTMAILKSQKVRQGPLVVYNQAKGEGLTE